MHKEPGLNRPGFKENRVRIKGLTLVKSHDIITDLGNRSHVVFTGTCNGIRIQLQLDGNEPLDLEAGVKYDVVFRPVKQPQMELDLEYYEHTY